MEYELLVESDGLLAVVELSKFFTCIGGNLEEVFEKNKKSHEVRFFFLFLKPEYG